MNETKTHAALLWMALALCLVFVCFWEPSQARAQSGASNESAYKADFDYLHKINNRIIGWLYQENGEINTPIVQGDDNAYYTKRLVDGSVSPHGTLFMDCANAPAFSDTMIRLYGRNAEEGETFSSLEKFEDQRYYEGHPRMLLITPGGNYEATLFAGIIAARKDDDALLLPQPLTAQSFSAYIDGLVSQSFFTPLEGSLPQWGDRILTLITYGIPSQRQRHALFARLRLIGDAGENAVNVSKLSMDERATDNGMVTLDGVGSFMVYAQNDRLWSGLRYEAKGSGKRRSFGDGGCGPTAAAMAIANLVEPSALPLLSHYADSTLGYTFCPCSVNNHSCTRRHVQYQLTSPEEYLRYLPLAVASFASGNNQWHILSRGEGKGTNMNYLEKLCEIYGLSVTYTRVAAEAVELLREGRGSRIVVSCATRGSPFTTDGHFVVMAAADDDYVYILDPLRNNDYASIDRRDYAEELAPGVVRIKVENAVRCNLSPHYVLEKNK